MIPQLCSKQIVSSTIFPDASPAQQNAVDPQMRRRYANQSPNNDETEDDAPDQDADIFRRKMTKWMGFSTSLIKDRESVGLIEPRFAKHESRKNRQGVCINEILWLGSQGHINKTSILFSCITSRQWTF